MDHPLDRLGPALQERRTAKLWREHRVVARREGAQAWLQGRSGPLLAFASNDYLGLSQSAALAEAQALALARWGVGSGASHAVCGHTQAHADMQDALALAQNGLIPEAQALGFCTGYLANLAIFSTLAAVGGRSLQIFSDRLNHASLVHGARHATEHHHRFAHQDTAALRQLLQASVESAPQAWRAIVVDAVFSMDGDEADLQCLLGLACEFNAMLVIDDAHGYGVLGPEGRGSLAAQLAGSAEGTERIIYMGTLGKALGLSGAFVVAHADWINAMRQWAPEAIYTTASPPAMAEAVVAALGMVHGAEGNERRTTLQARVAQLRQQLPREGLMASRTAIQPWRIGEVGPTLRLAQDLEAQGLWVPAIRPPTVPVGTARLRISLSSLHSAADIDRLAHAILESSS